MCKAVCIGGFTAGVLKVGDFVAMRGEGGGPPWVALVREVHAEKATLLVQWTEERHAPTPSSAV